MQLSKSMVKAARFLAEPQMIYAACTWSKFSLTSYQMISALNKQHIQPNTIIDVGANVGQFAVAAAKIYKNPQIYSFEPLPECVAELKRNVHKLSNVRVYPLALGDSEGEIVINVNAYSLSSSILPLEMNHRDAFPDAQVVDKRSVRISTLDNVCRGIDLAATRLLKLDVQGYEAHVLRGAVETLQKIDYVVLEASFKSLYQGEKLFTDILDILNNCRFKFLRPVGWLSDPETGEILQMDALFSRNA